MTGWLRRLAERPVPERRRPAITLLACACLTALAAALTHSIEPTRPGTGPAPPRPRPAAGSAGEVRLAAHTARAFLEDYLDYLHGRRTALIGASVALQTRLVGDAPHPSRTARRRRSRVVELHTELASGDSGRAVARVLDADTAFTITLALHRGPSGWEVSDVS